jgi:xylose isomerase
MKSKLSMPFWCVGNTISDPFGGPVMDGVSAIDVCTTLCQARQQGLIDFTSAHDDDLVRWDPAAPQDDQDPSSEASRTLQSIKAMMDKAGLQVKMVTCSLHGNTVFRNGGLTNPDPDIRALAAQKVMRTIRIGHFFGAQFLTYWVARDGFECQFAIPWDRCYGYIENGLNLATRYIKQNKFSIQAGTIESKPNEPRGEMFLATTGHALALISRLEDPSFWNVNPEILQHEGMTNLSAINAIAMAVHAGKLPFIHLGNQKPGQFDNDNPVLTGMDGLKETIGVLWMLEKANWKGHIEFDNHMLRTDAAPGKDNAAKLRMEFIRHNVDSVRLAEKKAEQLASNAELNRLHAEICDKPSPLAAALTGYDFKALGEAKIDYTKLNQTPVHVGALDLAFNKAILGLS